MDTLKFHVGPLQFDILPRSAYGIYQFLGKLLRQSRGGLELDPSQMPENIREDELRPELSTIKEDRQLLNVILNQSSSGCFAETRFIDGYYCVPEEGSANTKRVFGLLAQLLALQTSASRHHADRPYGQLGAGGRSEAPPGNGAQLVTCRDLARK